MLRFIKCNSVVIEILSFRPKNVTILYNRIITIFNFICLQVKKFITKEAVLLPIDVNFERALDPSEEPAGDGAGTKKVRRTLFSKMNPFPQKKIMTFNKHVQDFK